MSIDNPNHLEEAKPINNTPNQEVSDIQEMCSDYYKQFLAWRGSLSEDELSEQINRFIDKINSLGFEIDKSVFERLLQARVMLQHKVDNTDFQGFRSGFELYNNHIDKIIRRAYGDTNFISNPDLIDESAKGILFWEDFLIDCLKLIHFLRGEITLADIENIFSALRVKETEEYASKLRDSLKTIFEQEGEVSPFVKEYINRWCSDNLPIPWHQDVFEVENWLNISSYLSSFPELERSNIWSNILGYFDGRKFRITDDFTPNTNYRPIWHEVSTVFEDVVFDFLSDPIDSGKIIKGDRKLACQRVGWGNTSASDFYKCAGDQVAVIGLPDGKGFVQIGAYYINGVYYGEIANIRIDQDMRGEGLGSMLIDYAIHTLELIIQTDFIFVELANNNLVTPFQSRGFERDDSLSRYQRNGILSKFLPGYIKKLK